MQKRTYRSTSSLWKWGGIGALVAGMYVVRSWLDHMFDVMGSSPSAAERAAFGADLLVGWYILAAAFVLGLVATRLTDPVTAHRSEDTAGPTATCASEVDDSGSDELS